MGMRLGSLFLCFLLVPTVFAAGVAFNVTWYPTEVFPSNDIVNGADCEVTTGIVIADFNRDGIPDVAYSFNSCGSVVRADGGVIVKLGTGGGKLGPDVT